MHTQVLISREESCVPILSAVVKLPLSEVQEEEEEVFQQADFGSFDANGNNNNADMLVMG